MPSLTDVDAQQTIDETILEHEETISELKKRILELKATILALKTRRNTHCAVSKIPTELIADVFLHAKRFAQQSQAGHNRCDWDSDRNWLNVSSVCRQWRAVVVDTAQLWCSINLSWQAESRALAFLKRSKSAPLRVWFTTYSIYFDDIHINSPVSKAAIAEQRRIQELDIVLCEQDSLVQLFKLSPSGSAPALKILKLALYDGDEQRPSIPDGLFWHDMPALQVLELRNIFLHSQLPVLPRLTRLVLQNQPASWVIQSLRNTPVVKEIDISDLSSDFGTEIPARISLPNLTSLQIHAAHSSASKIFDFIEYPCSAIVNCTFHYLDNESDLSILQRVYSRFANRKAIVRVQIDDKSFTVQRWPLVTESPPYPTLSLPLPSSHNITQYFQLCTALNSPVRTLTLIGFENQCFAWRLAAWHSFHRLTSLRLSGCSADTLLSLLRAGGLPNPPLKKLKVVVIANCRFSFDDHRRDGAICNAMISLLEHRKEYGIPIRRLVLANCDITEDVINEFKGHVEVDWDGKVGFRSV